MLNGFVWTIPPYSVCERSASSSATARLCRFVCVLTADEEGLLYMGES